MPSFDTSRRVRHGAETMFDLVADVESYPSFLPFCRSLVVRSRTTLPDGREVIVADMVVAYAIMRESFASRVTLDRPALRIDVAYLAGPFSRMQNRWEFRGLEPRLSDVLFHIDYEFRSRALKLVMGAVFDRVFRMFAEAFEARADALDPA